MDLVDGWLIGKNHHGKSIPETHLPIVAILGFQKIYSECKFAMASKGISQNQLQ